MNGTPSIQIELIDQAAALLDKVRSLSPRVHCITNAAAQVFTANLLLAAGALPSLTVAQDEVAAFTQRASALLVNLGTLDPERRAAIPKAIAVAREAERPWVLDPVFVDVSPPRYAFARSLLDKKPNIIRCNSLEFESLSSRTVSAAALSTFSRAYQSVIALTGPVDRIVSGERSISIANGHDYMGRTTAMGCAGTALITAFSVWSDDHFTAAAAALLVIGVAGELAAQDAQGPGSFVPAFLDRLALLSHEQLLTHARISA